jgi:radical SAM protein with 4Fe4S-binding SPASM domain
MSWDTYKKIISDLSQYNLGKFVPYFENDPLNDDRIFDMIKYATDSLTYKHVEISTNLITYTPEKADRTMSLFPNIPHEIWISFHGTDEKTYTAISGSPNFDKVLENIFDMIRLSQQNNLNLRIRGSGSPRLTGRVWFTEKEYQKFWGNLLVYFSKKPAVEYYTYHDRARAKQMLAKDMAQTSWRVNTNQYCPRPYNWIHFLYNGDVVLCCMDYNRETVFGNINDNTLQEIFSSEKFLEIKKKSIQKPEDFICARCISPGG